MRGAFFLGDRKIEVREIPDPVPGPRDVILKIEASGMCGSDLPKYRLPFAGGGTASTGLGRATTPMIGGHEPCGVVVELGSAVEPHEAFVGQRVMDHHYKGCGNCKHCKAGWQQMCLHGAIVYGTGDHGGHAEYMKVPVSTLVTLPDALSYEVGAALACGSGTAYGALRRTNLRAGETIAVFGQGPVGLSATQFATAMGAHVIALDISPERRQLATEFGAHATIDPAAVDPVAAIKDLTHGEGAHKTLDASSNPNARAQAVRATRSWGTACYVGERDTVTLEVSPDLLRRQITLVGSWTFSTHGLAECAEFVADFNVDVGKLFTHRWKLDEINEAYELFDKQSSGKGVVFPNMN